MSTIHSLLSQQMIERLGWMLVHFVWQAAAVAVLLAVVLRLLRRSSSNVRYATACAALGLIVALPLFTVCSVPVRAYRGTGILPVIPNHGRDAHATQTPYRVTTNVEIAELPPSDMHPLRKASVAAAPVPLKERLVSTLSPTLPYLVLGWLIGVFGLSAWHLGGWAQLQRLKRRMVRPVADAVQTRLATLAERLGIHRAVGLMESMLVDVPTVVGWIKPVILLPASALTGLSGEQLEAILAHELAHIRRYDYLVNILQTVVEIFGFYHPALWWVSHRIRVERENCCDDLAVCLCGDSIRYARALTHLEEMRHSRTELAVAANGGSLISRIARLLGRPAPTPRPHAWLPGLIALLLVVALIIPAAWAIASSNESRAIISAYATRRSEPNSVVREPASTLPHDANSPLAPRPEIAVDFIVAFVRPNATLDAQTAQEVARVWAQNSPPDETESALVSMAVRAPGLLRLDRLASHLQMSQYFSGDQFHAFIRVLESHGYVRTIASPSVVTSQGQHAAISLNTNVDANNAGLNAAVAAKEDITDVTVGVTAEQDKDGNSVTLEADLEIAQRGGRDPSGGAFPPPISTRQVAHPILTTANDRYAVADITVPEGKGSDQEAIYLMARPRVGVPKSRRVSEDRVAASNTHDVNDVNGQVLTKLIVAKVRPEKKIDSQTAVELAGILMRPQSDIETATVGQLLQMAAGTADANQFTTAVKSLGSSGYVVVLSRPAILTREGQAGRIDIGSDPNAAKPGETVSGLKLGILPKEIEAKHAVQLVVDFELRQTTILPAPPGWTGAAKDRPVSIQSTTSHVMLEVPDGRWVVQPLSGIMQGPRTDPNAEATYLMASAVVAKQAKEYPIKQVDGILGDQTLVQGKWYKVGDTLAGAKIVSIGDTGIVVEREDQKRTFIPVASVPSRKESAADPNGASHEVSVTKQLRLNYEESARVVEKLPEAWRKYVRSDSDPNSRVITVTAPPQLFDQIAAEIKLLDHPPRQVLLTARVVTIEPGELANLGLNWHSPPSSDGQDPTGWLSGIRVGYTPDRTLADSLPTRLKQLESWKRAQTIADRQTMILDARPVQLRCLHGGWLQGQWIFETLSGHEQVASQMEAMITPRVGDDDNILLEMSIAVSDPLWKSRGSSLPIVTRRAIKNPVTIPDDGMAVIAGLDPRVAGLNDRSTEELAIFVTAKLMPENGQAVPPTTEPIAPAEAPVAQGAQVSLGLRLMYVSDKMLSDMQQGRLDSSVFAAEESKTLQEIGERIAKQERIILDETQLKVVLKAAQQDANASTLTSPRMTIIAGEPVYFALGTDKPISYTAGYTEPTDGSGRPVPQIERVGDPVRCQICPRLTPDAQIAVDANLTLTGVGSFQEKTYGDKLTYRVPEIYKLNVPLKDVRIPDGKTVLVVGPKAKRVTQHPESLKDEQPLPLLIFITAAKVDANSLPPGPMGGMPGMMRGGTTPADLSNSQAWTILRQMGCPPLLQGLPERLEKMSESAQRRSAAWREVADGGSVTLDVRVDLSEHVAFDQNRPGEIVVGFFADAKWSQPPVAVRRLPGPGVYTLTGLPAGAYQIGAIQEWGPDVRPLMPLGVQQTWPQAVEITPTRTAAAAVLLSVDFWTCATRWGDSSKSSGLLGFLSGVSRVRGQVKGPDGKPLPFVIMQVRSHPDVYSGHVAAADVLTDEKGAYQYDAGQWWPYTVSAVWEDPIPSAFAVRHQQKNLNRVFKGSQEIDFAFDPFPPGVAKVAGRVVDQFGRPITAFVLDVRTPDLINAIRAGKDQVMDGQMHTEYGYKAPFFSNDGSFKMDGLPQGAMIVNAIPFDTVAFEVSMGDDAVLKAGETTSVQVTLTRKRVFYGRVQFDDGSPAVTKPSPWLGAATVITLAGPVMDHGFIGQDVGKVDEDGYFAVHIGEKGLEALRSGASRLQIRLPETPQRRLDTVGEFPVDKLSEDKAKAGVVTIRRPQP